MDNNALPLSMKEQYEAARHVKQVAITGRWFYDFFVEQCTNLPADAVVTGIHHDWDTDSIRLRIQHPDFPPLDEGSIIPGLELVLFPLHMRLQAEYEKGKQYVLDNNKELIAVAQRGYPENCWICGRGFDDGQYFRRNSDGTWQHRDCRI